MEINLKVFYIYFYNTGCLKKNASGNSAISIADKKRWSDFCAPRWATLQYVVFTQQPTAALQVKH